MEFITCLAVGGLLDVSYLPTSFSPPGREKIPQRESNRQPLHSEMDTSPLSRGNLRSSRSMLQLLICYKPQ